jgi:hypothetical protein
MPHFVPIAIKERLCHEATDLLSTELRIVTSLIAAKRVGRIGLTVADLKASTGVHANMISLERRLWIVQVGTIRGATTRIWGPAPRAAVRLGVNAWLPILFTDEEIERVDPNEPGFLQPSPVREVALTGPAVVDARTEEPEGERAAS